MIDVSLWSLVADEIVTRMGKANKCAEEKRRSEFLITAEDAMCHPSDSPKPTLSSLAVFYQGWKIPTVF